MDDTIKDLDKSFCNENQSQNIKYYEVGMINMKKPSDLNIMNMSSDQQFSGLLPISTNKKLIDFTKSSNEFCIFNSYCSNKEVPYFFRILTRTKEEISEKDNNIYFERVFNYIKNQQNCMNDTFISSEICSPIRFQENSNLTNIQNKHNFLFSINTKFTLNDESIQSNYMNSYIYLERLFSQNPQEQIYRKNEFIILEKNKRKFLSSKRITFNILVVGESGTGKTTFIKCFQKIAEKLDESRICGVKDFQTVNSQEDEELLNDESICSSTRSFISYYIKSSTHKYDNLVFIDSPGYGNHIENTKWKNKIIEYIHNQFNTYKEKKDELMITEDNRVHLVLYFLTGPKKSVDFEYMKEFSKYANIIPVISKGDSLTKEEIYNSKKTILEKAALYNVEIFDVFKAITNLSNDKHSEKFFFEGLLGSCPPFLIVSSLKKNKYNCLIRKYSWGTINIENTDLSDFKRLYYAISCFIPFECIEKTKKFYKEFTKKKLSSKLNINKTKQNYWTYLSKRNIVMTFAIFVFGGFIFHKISNK